jgi:hypothetical protein
MSSNKNQNNETGDELAPAEAAETTEPMGVDNIEVDLGGLDLGDTDDAEGFLDESGSVDQQSSKAAETSETSKASKTSKTPRILPKKDFTRQSASYQQEKIRKMEEKLREQHKGLESEVADTTEIDQLRQDRRKFSEKLEQDPEFRQKYIELESKKQEAELNRILERLSRGEKVGEAGEDDFNEVGSRGDQADKNLEEDQADDDQENQGIPLYMNKDVPYYDTEDVPEPPQSPTKTRGGHGVYIAKVKKIVINIAM